MDIQKRKILPLNEMARVVLRKGCELASGPQKMDLLQINSWGCGGGWGGEVVFKTGRKVRARPEKVQFQEVVGKHDL